jgi:hypothetical protein
MNSDASTKNSGAHVSRRCFLRQSAVAAGLLAVGGLGSLVATREQIWRVRPIPGIKYSRADLAHFRYKIYPSVAAAKGRLPHRGLRYQVERFDMALPDTVTIHALFGGRKDLDFRVASDVKYVQGLGLDAEVVAGLVAG